MTYDELNQCLVLHKLKNTPLILRHKTMRYYLLYLKGLRNGYHKCLKFHKIDTDGVKVSGDVYISTEQMRRYKLSKELFEMNPYAIGRTDYLSIDPVLV